MPYPFRILNKALYPELTVEQESFDGHIMKLKAPENSTIWYTTDGSTPRDNTYYSYNNIYSLSSDFYKL